MHTEHTFVIWSCIRVKSEILSDNNPHLSDHSNVVTLLQFFLVYVSVVSYVAFLLSLLFLIYPCFWCLGKAVLCDCCVSWVNIT